LSPFIPTFKKDREFWRHYVKQLLTEDSYKQNALRLQEAIKRAGGVSRAADIIEQVMATGKPVLAQPQK
jgi:UDP:flavonoid glycosyltransferase YjiC (YdhE family)